MADQSTCVVCGKPATRTVTDHEHLPDDTFWEVDPLSPPWHLCDRHSLSPENCRARLVGMLACVDGALAQIDALGDDLWDTKSLTKAGDMRELLLTLRAGIERGLDRLTEA